MMNNLVAQLMRNDFGHIMQVQCIPVEVTTKDQGNN